MMVSTAHRAARQQGRRRVDEFTGHSTSIQVLPRKELVRENDELRETIRMWEQENAQLLRENRERRDDGITLQCDARHLVQDQMARTRAVEQQMAALEAGHDELAAQHQHDREQHSSAVMALQTEVRQEQAEHARTRGRMQAETDRLTEQMEAAHSKHVAVQERLAEEHTAARAQLEMDLTCRLNAESAAHVEAARERTRLAGHQFVEAVRNKAAQDVDY
jgi:hypothetical protein